LRLYKSGLLGHQTVNLMELGDRFGLATIGNAQQPLEQEHGSFHRGWEEKGRRLPDQMILPAPPRVESG
jgi:hypothetical protein